MNQESHVCVSVGGRRFWGNVRLAARYARRHRVHSVVVEHTAVRRETVPLSTARPKVPSVKRCWRSRPASPTRRSPVDEYDRKTLFSVYSNPVFGATDDEDPPELEDFGTRVDDFEDRAPALFAVSALAVKGRGAVMVEEYWRMEGDRVTAIVAPSDDAADPPGLDVDMPAIDALTGADSWAFVPANRTVLLRVPLPGIAGRAALSIDDSTRYPVLQPDGWVVFRLSEQVEPPRVVSIGGARTLADGVLERRHAFAGTTAEDAIGKVQHELDQVGLGTRSAFEALPAPAGTCPGRSPCSRRGSTMAAT